VEEVLLKMGAVVKEVHYPLSSNKHFSQK